MMSTDKPLEQATENLNIFEGGTHSLPEDTLSSSFPPQKHNYLNNMYGSEKYLRPRSAYFYNYRRNWAQSYTVPERRETIPERRETIPERRETIPERRETIPERVSPNKTYSNFSSWHPSASEGFSESSFSDKRFRKTPIPSYGIILFTIQDNQIYYLISQRRDTIEYIEYLRGRYTNQNIHYFLTLMTTVERERLLNHTFDELWDDLWINKSHKLYTEEYTKAKNKFNMLAPVLKDLIDQAKNFLTEPPWGFPKGKKNENEDDIACAFREFSEETHMTIQNYSIIKDSTFNEVYIGSDKKLYSTHYYICETDIKIPIVKLTNLNSIRTESVSEEIADLQWVTLEEACKKMNHKKQCLLRSVNKYICKQKRRPF